MNDDALLDAIADRLIDRIEDRVTDTVIERLAAQETPRVRPLTMDELIDLLPSTKTPEQWRRWLQVHSLNGEVPGAVKLGGAWCLRPDESLAWIDGRDQ